MFFLLPFSWGPLSPSTDKNTNFNHNPQPQRAPSTLPPMQPHLRGNGPTSTAGNEVKTGSESSVELTGRLQTFNTLLCRVVWRIIFVWGGLVDFKVRVEKLTSNGVGGGRLSNILKRVVVAVFFFGGIPKMVHFLPSRRQVMCKKGIEVVSWIKVWANVGVVLSITTSLPPRKLIWLTMET